MPAQADTQRDRAAPSRKLAIPATPRLAGGFLAVTVAAANSAGRCGRPGEGRSARSHQVRSPRLPPGLPNSGDLEPLLAYHALVWRAAIKPRREAQDGYRQSRQARRGWERAGAEREPGRVGAGCTRRRSVHPGAQSPGRSQWRGQGCPASNDPGAFPSLRIVGHAGEQSAQLDCGRQLAATIEGGADRGGVGFGDNEHLGSMGTRTVTGKTMGEY
jgi:hypothetical protein